MYFNRNGFIHLIPRPSFLGDDPDLRWNIRSIFIDSEDNLYLGSFFRGIFKISLESLYLSTNVENIESIESPLLPNMFTYKLLPNPVTRGQVSVEYFLQVGSNSKTNCDLYNINGDIIDNTKYEIQHIEGQLYRLTLDTSYLINGTYFIKISNEDSIIIEKFVKI